MTPHFRHWWWTSPHFRDRMYFSSDTRNSLSSLFLFPFPFSVTIRPCYTDPNCLLAGRRLYIAHYHCPLHFVCLCVCLPHSVHLSRLRQSTTTATTTATTLIKTDGRGNESLSVLVVVVIRRSLFKLFLKFQLTVATWVCVCALV